MTEMRRLLHIVEGVRTPTKRGGIIAEMMSPSFTHEELMVLWEAINQFADNQPSEITDPHPSDDEMPVGWADKHAIAEQLRAKLDAYVHGRLAESGPYVPGSEGDPAREFRKVGPNLVRKPGRSVEWEVVFEPSLDWVIMRVEKNAAMTQGDWQVMTGTRVPQFGIVGPGGVLSFPEREDAEAAIRAYEEGRAARGYTG